MTIDETLRIIPQILNGLQKQNELLRQLIREEQVPLLLSEEEAAKVLGIARSTLRKWVCEKRITVVKAGGNKFLSDDLQKFVKKNTIRRQTVQKMCKAPSGTT